MKTSTRDRFGVYTYPLGECGGTVCGGGQFDVQQSLGLPLQLRRIDRTTAIEATLGHQVVILTGAQVDQFWKMIDELKK